MVAGHLQEKNDFYYIVLSYKDAAGKRKTKWEATGLSVKRNKKNNAVFLSPSVSSCSSSYIVRSRNSWMSKGANLAPQEISIERAVLPAANL